MLSDENGLLMRQARNAIITQAQASRNKDHVISIGLTLQTRTAKV